jgi:hypothetical protein
VGNVGEECTLTSVSRTDNPHPNPSPEGEGLTPAAYAIVPPTPESMNTGGGNAVATAFMDAGSSPA